MGRDSRAGSTPALGTTSEQVTLVPIFLLHKKSVTRFTATPLSQKVTLSVGYLLASALITPLVHYQPFASKRLWRGILKLFGFFKGGLHYAVCFSIKKTPKAEVFFLGLI